MKNQTNIFEELQGFGETDPSVLKQQCTFLLAKHNISSIDANSLMVEFIDWSKDYGQQMQEWYETQQSLEESVRL